MAEEKILPNKYYFGHVQVAPRPDTPAGAFVAAVNRELANKSEYYDPAKISKDAAALAVKIAKQAGVKLPKPKK